MKLKALILIVIASFGLTLTAEAQSLPRKVRNVEVQDLDTNKARLPWWGEKNLLIFYVDPEVPKQNHDFITYIEETGRVQGPNIEGFGIVNLKDVPTYTRSELTDALHDSFGFRTDFTIISRSDMKRLISLTKKK